jgi:transposase-like protein
MSKDEKKNQVALLTKEGKSIAQIAKTTGLSKATVSNYRALLKDEGVTTPNIKGKPGVTTAPGATQRPQGTNSPQQSSFTSGTTRFVIDGISVQLPPGSRIKIMPTGEVDIKTH